MVCIALAAVGFLVNLLNGNTTGSVWFAIFTLVGVWLLIRNLSPDRERSGDPTQMGRRKFVRGVGGFAIVQLAFGTLFAMVAGQTSGAERALFTVAAVVLYLCAALSIVITILVYRRMPGDATNP